MRALRFVEALNNGLPLLGDGEQIVDGGRERIGVQRNERPGAHDRECAGFRIAAERGAAGSREKVVRFQQRGRAGLVGIGILLADFGHDHDGGFCRVVNEADRHAVDFKDDRAVFRVRLFQATLRGECVYKFFVFHVFECLADLFTRESPKGYRRHLRQATIVCILP